MDWEGRSPVLPEGHKALEPLTPESDWAALLPHSAPLLRAPWQSQLLAASARSGFAFPVCPIVGRKKPGLTGKSGPESANASHAPRWTLIFFGIDFQVLEAAIQEHDCK